MTRLPKLDLTLVIAGVLGIGAYTAVASPENLGAALAFGGGLLGGASIVRERSWAAKSQEETSIKVTSTFTALYENNGGLVDPFQLAYLANIEPERAYAFLSSLAQNTGGKTINVKNEGHVVFEFPHTKSTLEELTLNAQNWVKAQNQELVLELQKHKQFISLLQAQQAQQTQQTRTNALASPEAQSDIDPWTR